MTPLLSWMNGKKTYLVAAATVVYALLAYGLGYMTGEMALTLVMGALGMTGLRNALPPKA